MLISHLKKFIYVQTAKTASTTVEYYFEKYCMPDGEWTERAERYRPVYISDTGIIGRRGLGEDSEWRGHAGAQKIKEKIGDPIWGSYFKFCTIRNPYERAISMFFWDRVWMKKLPTGTLEKEAAEFEFWLMGGGFKPTTHVFLINNEFALDDVIRYESLNTDLQRVCERIGVPFVPETLSTFGSGLRPPECTSKAMYTAIGKDIIKYDCAFELDHFGYDFPTN